MRMRAAATRYSFGDNAERLGEFAWFRDNAGWKTHPVGEKRANGFGLYDMHGNVSEWCWDGRGGQVYKDPPVDDPRGQDGVLRVYRGGNCGAGAADCAAAAASGSGRSSGAIARASARPELSLPVEPAIRQTAIAVTCSTKQRRYSSTRRV